MNAPKRSRPATPEHPGGRRAAITNAAVGLLAGGIGGFVSLFGMYFGIALAIAAGALLVVHAKDQRLATLGGLLVGAGAVTAVLLSPAVSNHDPAVTYDPSTVPALILGVAVALLGTLTLAIAAWRVVVGDLTDKSTD